MDMMYRLFTSSCFSEESQEQQPEHVKCSQQRGNDSYSPGNRALIKSIGQDLVFREEAGKRRNPCNRQNTNKERDVRHRDILSQSTHLPDILFVMHRMNDRSSTQE